MISQPHFREPYRIALQAHPARKLIQTEFNFLVFLVKRFEWERQKLRWAWRALGEVNKANSVAFVRILVEGLVFGSIFSGKIFRLPQSDQCLLRLTHANQNDIWHKCVKFSVWPCALTFRKKTFKVLWCSVWYRTCCWFQASCWSFLVLQKMYCSECKTIWTSQIW